MVRIIALCLTMLALTGCNSSSSSSATAPPPVSGRPGAPDPVVERSITAKLPPGVPAAATKPLVERPTADSALWPFPEGINLTAGSGRYFGGAYYWTDFIYDGYGPFAGTVPLYNIQTPNAGSLTYPTVALDSAAYPGPDMSEAAYNPDNDPFQGNAADIFALALGFDDSASYWRVDWVTLADPSAAIVAFAIDSDNDSSTGTSGDWALIPNMRTDGIDTYLLLSSAGVYLANAAGESQKIGDIGIDLATQSFIGKVPHSILPLGSENFRVYALSGLHNGSGGFFSDVSQLGGTALSPPVYNVGFRDYSDEPVANNFWMSNSQAQALAAGDITDFSVELVRDSFGLDEEEPRPEKFSVRWYTSSLGPAQFGRGGIYTGQDATLHQTAQNSDDITLYASYYDTLQPYTLWVPDQYDHAAPTPEKLTLVLHSFTQNHMQYAATMPNFLRETCNDLRQSFCLTVLGRGVSGFYEFASGVDLWEAWRHVASQYELDPTQTFTSGFSMGALGSQRLMIKYPDVFAAGVILAGAQSDEQGISDQNGNVPGCFGELQMENLKWNGYYHAAGTFDQLIPFTQQRDTVDRMRDLGYRYTFDHYHAEDHVAWVLKDGQYPAFAEATDWLVGASGAGDAAPTHNTLDPGEIIYRFTENDQHPEFGLGAYGAWWINDLSVADPDKPVQGYQPSLSQTGRECSFTNSFSGVTLAPRAGRVHAMSGARPMPELTGLISPQPIADGNNPQIRPDQNSSPRIQQTGPHTHEYQAWTLGDTPAPTGLMTLDLQNVATITVDMARAGLAARDDWQIQVTNDSSTRLTLRELNAGDTVDAAGVLHTADNGQLELLLSAGTHTLQLAP